MKADYSISLWSTPSVYLGAPILPHGARVALDHDKAGVSVDIVI